MKRLVSVLLLGLACVGARAQSPAFDCALALSTAEHLVCAHPELAAADAGLNQVYSALMKKPTRPAALRSDQRRWLRQTRDRCTSADCVRTAYRERMAELNTHNTKALLLAGARFEPVFERRIAQIDDTWVVQGLRLRADTARRLQLELHVDPGDHLAWTLPGPRVQLYCRDPDQREGFAGRFQHRRQAHGVEFTAVQRHQGQGFILMTLELGKDVPLHQDIVCSVAFTEWLLDRPSTLYVLEAHRP